MLLNNSAIRLSLLTCFLGWLTACNGNKLLADKFAPDPKLKDNPVIINSPQKESPTPSPSKKLPVDFPSGIPLYPGAKLLNIQTKSTEERVETLWVSADKVNDIESFYRQELQSNKWKITNPSLSTEKKLNQSQEKEVKELIASRNDLQITVVLNSESDKNESTISPSSSLINENNSGKAITFIIQYQKITNSKVVQPKTKEEKNQTPITSNSDKSTVNFSDLDQVSEKLRGYIEDLTALGILTSSSDKQQFQPNEIITRRDYARWLVAANNQMHTNRPSQQIRLASEKSQPAFQDVGKDDPDFTVIQGLAEAGLIPSTLTNDTTAVLFRPDAPLTRESLILWKVPLDNRQALPTASIEAVKETWGFQDTAKIDSKVLRSLFVDFQNGEQANVRRVFGYTTLFQPKKAVTRREAATALWYFGFQGDGISAKEALQLKDNQ